MSQMLAKADRFAPTRYHVPGYNEGGNSILDRDPADEYNPKSFFGEASAVTGLTDHQLQLHIPALQSVG
eukprot:3881872-Pleurochrysis_carterae.AAC.1